MYMNRRAVEITGNDRGHDGARRQFDQRGIEALGFEEIFVQCDVGRNVEPIAADDFAHCQLGLGARGIRRCHDQCDGCRENEYEAWHPHENLPIALS
jgi:hypothetical protein